MRSAKWERSTSEDPAHKNGKPDIEEDEKSGDNEDDDNTDDGDDAEDDVSGGSVD